MQYHNKYPDCVIISSFETTTCNCRPNYNSHTVLSTKSERWPAWNFSNRQHILPIVAQLVFDALKKEHEMPTRNSWTQQHSRLLSSKLLRLTNKAAFITSNFSVAFIFFITEKRQTNFQYPLYTAPIWFAYIFPKEKRKRWISFISILMSKLQNNQISKKKIFKILIDYSKTGIII